MIQFRGSGNCLKKTVLVLCLVVLVVLFIVSITNLFLSVKAYHEMHGKLSENYTKTLSNVKPGNVSEVRTMSPTTAKSTSESPTTATTTTTSETTAIPPPNKLPINPEWEDVANTLLASIDESVDPCDAVKQARIAFNACNEHMDPNNDDEDSIFQSIEKEIKSFGGWPMATNDTNSDTYPSPEALAGTLAGRFRIQTLVQVVVLTDWYHPTKQLLQLGQSVLTEPTSYYTNATTWNSTNEDKLREYIFEAVQSYANLSGFVLDNDTLQTDVANLVQFEHTLAGFQVLPKDERDYTKLYHIHTTHSFSSRLAPKVKIGDFLASLKKELSGITFTDELDRFNVQEPSFWNQTNKYLTIPIGDDIQRVLQNYLIWRFFESHMYLLPSLKTLYLEMREVDEIWKLEPNWPPIGIKKDGNWNADADNNTESYDCVFLLMWVKGVVRNVAYPSWLLNDTALDANIGLINPAPGFITEQDDYWNVMLKLKTYQIRSLFSRLLSATDRDYYIMPVTIVNAAYAPTLNSITIPAAILSPPYFNTSWPHSLNYGGIGMVIGHELTHGFDNEGVHWDAVGKLQNCSWMDKESYAGFVDITKCVQYQYGNFCYADVPDPNCINGFKTQGENIADNGGIKAAYYAYKQRQTLEGTPLRLPGHMAKYTHDQLFFLSFGQIWCESRNGTSITSQLLSDHHSPARDRIQGALRNFHAFGEAFDCPVGSNMRPQKHCQVW